MSQKLKSLCFILSHNFFPVLIMFPSPSELETSQSGHFDNLHRCQTSAVRCWVWVSWGCVGTKTPRRERCFHVRSIIHPRIRNTEAQRNQTGWSEVRCGGVNNSQNWDLLMFRWKIKVCLTADVKTVDCWCFSCALNRSWHVYENYSIKTYKMSFLAPEFLWVCVFFSSWVCSTQEICLLIWPSFNPLSSCKNLNKTLLCFRDLILVDVWFDHLVSLVLLNLKKSFFQSISSLWFLCILESQSGLVRLRTGVGIWVGMRDGIRIRESGLKLSLGGIRIRQRKSVVMIWFFHLNDLISLITCRWVKMSQNVFFCWRTRRALIGCCSPLLGITSWSSLAAAFNGFDSASLQLFPVGRTWFARVQTGRSFQKSFQTLWFFFQTLWFCWFQETVLPLFPKKPPPGLKIRTSRLNPAAV